MKARILGALARFDPRLLRVVMVLAIVFLAFEGWYLALRKPYQEYEKVLATQTALVNAGANPKAAQGELPRLVTELSRLSERLASETRLPASDDKMVASLMSELDWSARSNGLLLAGIRPGVRRRVLSFEEASFEIIAQGKYLALCQWLLGFEATLSQRATVTDFTMKSADEGRQVALTAKVALYRALPVP